MFQSMSCCKRVSNLKPETVNPKFVQVTRETHKSPGGGYRYNVVVQPTIDTAFIFSLVTTLDVISSERERENGIPPMM